MLHCSTPAECIGGARCTGHADADLSSYRVLVSNPTSWQYGSGQSTQPPEPSLGEPITTLSCCAASSADCIGGTWKLAGGNVPSQVAHKIPWTRDTQIARSLLLPGSLGAPRCQESSLYRWLACDWARCERVQGSVRNSRYGARFCSRFSA